MPEGFSAPAHIGRGALLQAVRVQVKASEIEPDKVRFGLAPESLVLSPVSCIHQLGGATVGV
jgi:hypothetical protein